MADRVRWLGKGQLGLSGHAGGRRDLERGEKGSVLCGAAYEGRGQSSQEEVSWKKA